MGLIGLAITDVVGYEASLEDRLLFSPRPGTQNIHIIARIY